MAERKRKRQKTVKGLMRGMKKKLWMFFLIVCIAFCGLLGRIMYIQHTSGQSYEKQVLSQMSYDGSIIPYKRGDIVDTNGSIIATSIDVYALILDAYILSRNPDCIDSTIDLVTAHFPQISKNTIRDILAERPDSRYNVLLKNIPYEDMESFSEIMKSDEHKNHIYGIWFEKSYRRHYPYGSLAADVVGFTSGDGRGAIGLENSYNDVLSGINGRTYGYLGEEDDPERHTVEPKNGSTLISTIDINIQNIVEKEIKDFNDRLSTEGARGSLSTAALVMNCKNGEILAMADYPTFDLNDPRDLSGLYSQETIDEMTSEEKLDALNQLWQNFAIAHTFEPGSTFKPFTVACGLESGALVGNETFYCDGGEHIGPDFVACVNRNGHGMETIADSLADSCNDALMQMSYRIGAHFFHLYQRLFGFGQRTNVDITGEARTDSLLYDEKDLGRTINIATNSFGQNFNVTMIQLASAFCSLINGGKLYEPHIIKAIQDSSGRITEQREPVVEKVTVSETVSAQMRDYLLNVVKNGTGSLAGVEGYSIGGKTGTAQKLPRGMGNYLVSFIGFAPADDPEIVVYVVVDEPNVEDQAHSSYAQEIAHNIFKQVLPYLNIKKDKAPQEEIQE